MELGAWRVRSAEAPIPAHSVGLFVLTRAAELGVQSAQAPRPCRQALDRTIWSRSDRVAKGLEDSRALGAHGTGQEIVGAGQGGHSLWRPLYTPFTVFDSHFAVPSLPLAVLFAAPSRFPLSLHCPVSGRWGDYRV